MHKIRCYLWVAWIKIILKEFWRPIFFLRRVGSLWVVLQVKQIRNRTFCLWIMTVFCNMFQKMFVFPGPEPNICIQGSVRCHSKAEGTAGTWWSCPFTRRYPWRVPLSTSIRSSKPGKLKELTSLAKVTQTRVLRPRSGAPGGTKWFCSGAYISWSWGKIQKEINVHYLSLWPCLSDPYWMLTWVTLGDTKCKTTTVSTSTHSPVGP
jgi:hypothetical protein